MNHGLSVAASYEPKAFLLWLLIGVAVFLLIAAVMFVSSRQPDCISRFGKWLLKISQLDGD